MRFHLAILLLLLLISPASAVERAEARFAWQVLGVKDGDTLSVRLPGLPEALNPVAIRVRGIDTPEKGGRAKCTAERDLARRATSFTRSWVERGKRIEFGAPSWDKYGGRIDADVWIDGALLSERLIAAGLARRYEGGKRAEWCG